MFENSIIINVNIRWTYKWWYELHIFNIQLIKICKFIVLICTKNTKYLINMFISESLIDDYNII
jgi:hypothetical protein